MWWRRFAKARGDPDPVAFQARLGRAFGIDPRRYPAAALHRDFREVLAKTARGQRVLYKILEWGHVYQPSFVHGDPHGTAFRDGERNLALRILAALNAEAFDDRTAVAVTDGDHDKTGKDVV